MIKNRRRKIKLGVIFGGRTAEHEVSLAAAPGILENLNREKYSVKIFVILKTGDWLIGKRALAYIEKYKDRAGIENGITERESRKIKTANWGEIISVLQSEVELVLPIMAGPYSEDGKLQGMLETLSIPYVFSGVLTSALAMDKNKTKIIADSVGLRVIPGMVVDSDAGAKKAIKELTMPIIVKPLELGSSVGISIVRTEEELKEQIKNALKYGNEVLLEKYIAGREFTATIMGNKNPEVLAITEIIPVVAEFYDYKAKYQEGGSEHICPAKLPKTISRQMKKWALRIYQNINCRDLARVDFILSDDGEIYFLEVNTIPGMTPTSLAPEAGKVAGMKFEKFLDKLIDGALRRYR